jgi:hypothetical protein
MFKNQTTKSLQQSSKRKEIKILKTYLVAILLVTIIATFAIIAHYTTSSVSASPNAAQTIFLPVTSSGYYEGAHLDGIAGRIFAQGKPAVEVNLDLRVYTDLESSDLVATKPTDKTGYYFFSNVDSLETDETYYVRFGPNTTNPKYVYSWYGPPIESFKKGDNVFGGRFDIADVQLESPETGVVKSFPIVFRWEKRGLPGDTYRLVIIDYNEDVYWRTHDLGDVDSFTMNGLALGMAFNKQYSWYIEVYSASDSFGESFMEHEIKFLRPVSQQKSFSEDVFIPGSGRGGR